MTEPLQHLIERLQTEGVRKADEQAAAIVAAAEEKAAALVRAAEARAKEAEAQARTQAARHTEQGRLALEQAARDLLIAARQRLEELFAGTVRATVEEALDTETVQRMLVALVEGHAARSSGEGRVEAVLGEADHAHLADGLIRRFQDRFAKGLEVRVDSDLKHGFRVSFDGQRAYHDFSAEAVAEALARLVRPQLAELLQGAAAEDGKKDGAERA